MLCQWQHMMSHWKSAGQAAELVLSECNTVGKTLWRLTDRGRKEVCTCWRLTNPANVLQPGQDVLSMSKYQLLLALQDRGWQMQAVAGGGELKRVRKLCYQQDTPHRVWYMKSGQHLEDLKVEYLQALLLAEDHKRDVPHLRPWMHTGAFWTRTTRSSPGSASCDMWLKATICKR